MSTIVVHTSCIVSHSSQAHTKHMTKGLILNGSAQSPNSNSNPFSTDKGIFAKDFTGGKIGAESKENEM